MFNGLVKTSEVEETEKTSEVFPGSRFSGLQALLNKIKGGAGRVKGFATKHQKATDAVAIGAGGGLGYGLYNRYHNRRRAADQLGPETAL